MLQKITWYLLFLTLLLACKSKKEQKQEIFYIVPEGLLYFPLGNQYINLQTLQSQTDAVHDSMLITHDHRYAWMYNFKKYSTISSNGFTYNISNTIDPIVTKVMTADTLTNNDNNYYLPHDSGVIWIHQIPKENLSDVILYDSANHVLWHTVINTLDTNGRQIMHLHSYTGNYLYFEGESSSVLIQTSNGAKRNLDYVPAGFITDLDGRTIIGVAKRDSSYVRYLSYFGEDKPLKKTPKMYDMASTASNNSQYFIAYYAKNTNTMHVQAYSIFTDELLWEKSLDMDITIQAVKMMTYEKRLIIDVYQKSAKKILILDAIKGDNMLEENY